MTLERCFSQKKCVSKSQWRNEAALRRAQRRRRINQRFDRRGAGVNAVDVGQGTPLHYAIEHNQEEAAEVLLEASADGTLHSQNWGHHCMVRRGVALILESCADYATENEEGGHRSSQVEGARMNSAAHGGIRGA